MATGARLAAWSIAASALALIGALQGASADAGSASLRLKSIGSFHRPVFVENAPGAKRLLFVAEAEGTIAVVKDGRVRDRPFLNITGRVLCCGEQGFLSLAFAPNYERSRRFYVYYTNNRGNIEIDGFRRSRGSATRANPASRVRVIVVPHQQAHNHNGGQVAFGPDGHLYLAPGDGGPQGDPEHDAQRKDSLLGKILRIDPKASGGYTNPRSNPFVGRSGRNEIYSLGLRNPYRFSFDGHDLWVGDVGWGHWEEIDHVTLSQANGVNFGWNVFEGPDPCGDCESSVRSGPPYKFPVHAYRHGGVNESGCAVIGGYVVHSRSLRDLNGKYLYSDNCAGDIRAFNPANDNVTFPGNLDVPGISSFGEGRGGRIYAASVGGAVYRIAER